MLALPSMFLEHDFSTTVANAGFRNELCPVAAYYLEQMTEARLLLRLADSPEDYLPEEREKLLEAISNINHVPYSNGRNTLATSQKRVLRQVLPQIREQNLRSRERIADLQAERFEPVLADLLHELASLDAWPNAIAKAVPKRLLRDYGGHPKEWYRKRIEPLIAILEQELPHRTQH